MLASVFPFAYLNTLPHYWADRPQDWWDGYHDGIDFSDGDEVSKDPRRYGINELYTMGFHEIEANIVLG